MLTVATKGTTLTQTLSTSFFSPKTMLMRVSAPAFMLLKLVPYIEPVLSRMRASSMPLVRRWITVSAATVIWSWPKTRMKTVGVVASAERVTVLAAVSNAKSKSVTVILSVLSPKFASKNCRATASASSSRATRPAARPAASRDLAMRVRRR